MSCVLHSHHAAGGIRIFYRAQGGTRLCAPCRLVESFRIHLTLNTILPRFLLCVPLALCPAWAGAAAFDLRKRPGTFWQQPDGLPVPVVTPTGVVRFASLAALTDHALRERAETRAAWLGIQAEAARLDGATVPTPNRYGPSLSLAYVLVDFGARAASIDAQRYQLMASLLTGNRTLQDTVAEVEAAYFALLAARAQVTAQIQQEIALRASLDAVDARLRGGLASRADQLRARAALVEAELARQAAERDRAKAEAALKQAAGIAQTQTLELDWQAVPPDPLAATTLLADLLQEAQRNRPDLQALQAAATSAHFEAERARAARWPSLSLAANTGRTLFLDSDRSPSPTYSVGVNVTMPLFDGERS